MAQRKKLASKNAKQTDNFLLRIKCVMRYSRAA